MNKRIWDGWIIAAGLLLLTGGALLSQTNLTPWALPYVCIGVGAGLLGHGAGNAVARHMYKKHPAAQKQVEIEQKDERNAAITNRAKAKAYDAMLFVFGALMLAFALMGVKTAAVLLLVLAYLLVVGCYIYYRWKYEQEM